MAWRGVAWLGVVPRLSTCAYKVLCVLHRMHACVVVVAPVSTQPCCGNNGNFTITRTTRGTIPPIKMKRGAARLCVRGVVEVSTSCHPPSSNTTHHHTPSAPCSPTTFEPRAPPSPPVVHDGAVRCCLAAWQATRAQPPPAVLGTRCQRHACNAGACTSARGRRAPTGRAAVAVAVAVAVATAMVRGRGRGVITRCCTTRT